MNTEKKIAKIVIDILNEKKVEDIVLIDISRALPIADYFVIGTVATSHQISSIVKELDEKLEEFKLKQINRSAGEQNGWFLLDYNLIIIHLFTTELRDYYQLENLWKNIL